MSFRIPMILAAAVLTLWLPAQALAVAPDPSLRPVTITAAPGTISARVSPIPVLITDASEMSSHIRVDNISALDEHVGIAVTNYTIDAAGKPVAASAEFQFGSAAWYHFETSEFSLPAGTSRDIPFTLAVPADAAAGDHFAALNVTVQAIPGQVAAPKGASARSVLVFQSRLQHRVAGAAPQTPTVGLSASNDMGTVHFTARVGNAGNTIVGHQADPTPTLTLYNISPWGNASTPERSISVAGFYVAPQSQRDVAADWTDLPILGQYRAVFTLPAADGQPQVTAETTVTVVNWPVLVGIGIALGLGLTILVLLRFGWRRARRRSPSNSPSVNSA
jgi:hypothetical protein